MSNKSNKSNETNRTNKKVVVALSGGVDSSVSAALLKEQGFEVIGVFMRVWDGDQSIDDRRWTIANSKRGAIVYGQSAISQCPWVEDQFEARRAAEHLGIPFYTINLEKEYKEAVVDYFFREYASGRTPNPDVLCNSEIKFGVFLKRMLEMGADCIATGHYARRSQKSKVKSQKFNNHILLLRGVDPKKDQTYFLWKLTKDQLKHVIFPVGTYTKKQVRDLAKRFGLPNANRKDSQGICFIGPVDVAEFLKTQLPVKKGKVVTTDGQEVGEHDGAWFYTIGQRQGVVGGAKRVKRACLAGRRAKREDWPALYILDKDIKRNVLVVGPADDPKLWAKGMIVNQINWLTDYRLQTTAVDRLQCQIRYQQKPIDCEIRSFDNDSFEVMFTEPVRAVTPGQSAVFYHGDVMLCGGLIENPIF